MFKPINKRIIVKVVAVENKSRIIKPEAFAAIETGVVSHEVVEVSDDLTVPIKVGDFAVYQSHAGVEYYPNGNTPNDPDYKVLTEHDLMGVQSASN